MRYLTLIASLVLMACGSTNTIDIQTPMYVYGDSISAGLSMPNYVDDIAATMNLFVVNKAIGGTYMTSPNQYMFIVWDWGNAWQAGSYVIFGPGHNDATVMDIDGTNTTYQELYAQDLTTIVQDMSGKPIHGFISTPIFTCDTGSNNSAQANAAIAIYAQINRDVVAKVNASNVTLIDFNMKFTPTMDTTIDCTHPSVLGNQQMAQIFFQSIGCQL